MKRTIVISTVVILGFAGSAQAALFSPIRANASLTRLGFLHGFLDYEGSGPAGNTIDGSGFPGNVDNVPPAQGTISVAHDPKDSPVNNWYFNSDQGALPQQVYYDLGSVMTISSVVIWNTTPTVQTAPDDVFGIPIARVDVGTTPASVTGDVAPTFDIPTLAVQAWTDNITDASLTTAGDGQVLTFSSPVTTRYLRVNADLAHPPTPFAGGFGYNEFAVDVVPEPSSLALLAFGLMGLCGCRRLRRNVA